METNTLFKEETMNLDGHNLLNDEGVFYNPISSDGDDGCQLLQERVWHQGEDNLLPLIEDDTMDANMNLSQFLNDFIPHSPVGPPDRTIFSGDLNFEVEIYSAHTNKSKYVYSHQLNSIYVDMAYSFSVMFKWDSSRQPHNTMLVRATTVFSDQAQAGKRVMRCAQHYHDPVANANIAEPQRSSVLHSASEPGAADVHYCGDAAAADQFLSVVARLPAPGAHAYQFACKNSCSSGINRRSIALLFTLEDNTGTVYGRQTVGARVCSCPKRDMARDEKEAPPGKRLMRRAPPAAAPAPPPAPKRARRDFAPDTDEPIQLPPITVLGRHAYNAGLRVMLDMMKMKRDIHATNHQPTQHVDDVIATFKAHLGRGDSQT